MNNFRFVTEWDFEAQPEQIWTHLTEPEALPSWWPGFERAELLSGGKDDIGSVTGYRVRGDFGLLFNFTMTLEAAREPEYLLLRANGDFVGTGEWRVRRLANGTQVIYTWQVAVQPFFVRLLSRLPGARRYLQRSHDRVMAAGGTNLAELLRRHEPDDG